MSNLQNDMIKETICEEIGSMTVDEFQDALENFLVLRVIV